jgi:hypothetical protein
LETLNLVNSISQKVQPGDFSLIELQNWMQGMLVQHLPVTDDGGVKPEDVVNASKRLSAVRHLNIYRQSYIARLRACMHSQFGGLAYALGNELFQAFADQYLDSCPSESYTLNTLGAKFPAFLQQTRPDATQEQKEHWPDFMIELAEFEYALSEVFDEKVIERGINASDDTPDESLKLSSPLRLFYHRFPICNYYLEYSQDKKPDLPFPEESYCAVTRRDYKLGLFTIRGAQYYFLKNMQEGNSVSGAKEDIIKNFHFGRDELEAIWPKWKTNFITSGFLGL